MGKKEETRRVYIDNNLVHLKKGMFGYRVVYPIKNEDGTINWFNLLTGGWENIIKTTIIILILGFLIYSYLHDTSMCRNLMECGAKCPEVIKKTGFNLTIP